LVGYWNFDGNVNDLSGQGNHGSINGTVSFVQGKFGGTNDAAAPSVSAIEIVIDDKMKREEYLIEVGKNNIRVSGGDEL
jgi:hypothetical protein